MLYFRRSRFLRFVILPLMLIAFLPACHKWVALEPPIALAIAEESGTIRVTLTDNSRMVLKEPRVSGDSLVALGDTVGVALNDVQQVEGRRPNVLATVLVVSGAVVLALVPLYALNCSIRDVCD